MVTPFLLDVLDAQATQDGIVAFGLQLLHELGAAGLHDAPVGHHVDLVGSNVVQNALVVGDEQHAHRGLLLVDSVDPIADDAHRVDIQT